jgi:hypothetical protein
MFGKAGIKIYSAATAAAIAAATTAAAATATSATAAIATAATASAATDPTATIKAAEGGLDNARATPCTTAAAETAAAAAATAVVLAVVYRPLYSNQPLDQSYNTQSKGVAFLLSCAVKCQISLKNKYCITESFVYLK